MQEAHRQRDASADEQRPDVVLQASIDRCRRVLAWQEAARRAIVLLAGAALMPLLVVIVDHHWPGGLPGSLPAALGRIWGVSVWLAGAGIIVLALARRPSRLFAARFLEKLVNIPHNLLVNALLLEHEPAGAYAYGAAVRHAASQIKASPAIRWSQPGALRKPAVAAAIVAVAWFMYGLVCPKPIWPSLARFFGLGVAVPTATVVELIRPPAGQPVLANEPLEVEFVVYGRQPERVIFETLRSDRSSEVTSRLECRPEPGGRWVVTLAPHEVGEDIHFRCRANDAVLRGLIPVVPQPTVIAIEADVEPPEYTGWPAEQVAGGDLEVLVGTRVTLRMRANVPVRDAVLVMLGPAETRTRMTVDQADPATMTVSMLCTQSASYWAEFTDQWGHAACQPAAHQLIVRDDAPPIVEIVDPQPEAIGDSPMDITKVGLLRARARDDVKVEGLAAVWQQGPITKRLSIAVRWDAVGRQAAGGIELSELGIEAGKPAVVWFEAVDNRVLPDGRAAPQVTKSQQLKIMRPLEVARKVGRDGAGSEMSGGAAGEGAEGSGRQSGAAGDQGGSGQQQAADDAERGSEGGDQTAQGGPAGESAQDSRNQSAAKAEQELKEFVEKHGQEAKEAARKLCGQPASPQTRPASGESEEGPESADFDGMESPGGKEDGQAEVGSEQEAGGEGPGGQPGGQQGSGPESAGPSAGAPSGTATAAEQQRGGADEGGGPSSVPASSQGVIELDGLFETVDLLELLNRGEKIDEALLTELGWPSDKVGTFVKALERLHETVRQAGLTDSLQVLRINFRPGREEVSPGSGLSQAVSTEVDAGADRGEALGRIRPVADQRVPAYLRAVLDAYYRAMSEFGTPPASAPASR
jgi:hypothetical protein